MSRACDGTYDEGRLSDVGHEPPVQVQGSRGHARRRSEQVVSGRRGGGGPSVGGAPHHGVAERRQGDGDPDGRRVRGHRQVGVHDAEPSRRERVAPYGLLHAVQAVEPGPERPADVPRTTTNSKKASTQVKSPGLRNKSSIELGPEGPRDVTFQSPRKPQRKSKVQICAVQAVEPGPEGPAGVHDDSDVQESLEESEKFRSAQCT